MRTVMRQIEVSTDVFGLIWAARQPGEESENEILLRILSKNPAAIDPAKESKKMSQGSVSLGHAYWWQVVEYVMEQIGRPAPLAEIYRAVADVCRENNRRMPRELEATVRGTLEDNSSDSDRYKKVRDIFCMPDGKHIGVWALRRKAK
jgi:hypothetical protein